MSAISSSSTSGSPGRRPTPRLNVARGGVVTAETAVVAAAAAMPVNFIGNKLWTFGGSRG